MQTIRNSSNDSSVLAHTFYFCDTRIYVEGCIDAYRLMMLYLSVVFTIVLRSTAIHAANTMAHRFCVLVCFAISA